MSQEQVVTYNDFLVSRDGINALTAVAFPPKLAVKIATEALEIDKVLRDFVEIKNGLVKTYKVEPLADKVTTEYVDAITAVINTPVEWKRAKIEITEGDFPCGVVITPSTVIQVRPFIEITNTE